MTNLKFVEGTYSGETLNGIIHGVGYCMFDDGRRSSGIFFHHKTEGTEIRDGLSKSTKVLIFLCSEMHTA